MSDAEAHADVGEDVQHSTSRILHNSASGLQLPFDIIHTLLEFTSIVDLVNFCSTCKALRIHLRNESIWRRVCQPYGLRDFTYFPGQSAQPVYTQLLHRYGCLLGLWANDSPFYGKILEFRLFPGDESEQGGIIGEIWSSPSVSPAIDPVPPSYVRAVKLSFEDGVSSSESPGSSVGSSAPSVRVFCDRGATSQEDFEYRSSRHLSSLVRLSATNLGKFLQFYRKKVNLPEFPPHISPWYDKSRGLPRIPELPEVTSHQGELIKLYPAARLPAVFVAPTAVMKPAAISIRCPLPPEQCRCHVLHTTVLPFANLDLRAPRYYPLKSCILPGVDPGSSDWSVDDLEGIWYGSYGPSGTECIYLALCEERGSVEATKITGDVHVPRGCVSWILHVAPEHQREAVQGYWTAVRTDGVVPRRLLMGHGTIAGRGFTDMAIVELMAGMVSADQIDIFWAEIHEFRSYRRYKGRPPS
ncbi:hypothetical protein OH77DRAFT_1420964 [Trametes cingulata]|nr:hypothetical protein OH77DRAFT_1420964 [Trametes cingulata]